MHVHELGDKTRTRASTMTASMSMVCIRLCLCSCGKFSSFFQRKTSPLIFCLATDNFQRLNCWIWDNISTFNVYLLPEKSTDNFKSYFCCPWTSFALIALGQPYKHKLLGQVDSVAIHPHPDWLARPPEELSTLTVIGCPGRSSSYPPLPWLAGQAA
jgi:hypothetical protein